MSPRAQILQWAAQGYLQDPDAALALAQHLSVDAALTDVAALRLAILAATEQRRAERRAAAS